MIVVMPLVLMVPMMAAIIAISVAVTITVSVVETGSAIIAVVVLVFGQRKSAENQGHAQKDH